MTELSYRMILIDGVPAGLLGLDELFDELFMNGYKPQEGETSTRLLKGLRRHNYVPKPAIDHYRLAMEREYMRYYLERSKGEGYIPKEYGFWEGIPRENIPWFPIVSAELCDGCGKCIEICPKDVFILDENDKAMVVEPFLCIVGCCFCKSVCDPHAIIMPNRDMLDQFRHGQRKQT
jgi:NAD-dependent dihydropyrimidine dehydrogenase PreA subunit